jgi:hypothetical protein
MPQEPTPQELEQLRHAIFTRRKVEAIKLYRKFSGCDLKDAKDYIEALTSELELSHPERIQPKPKGWSVTTFIAFLVIVAMFFLFLLKLKGGKI